MAALIVGSGGFCLAQGTGKPPELLEVYGLIRSNLTGTTQEEIDRRAVDALIAAFGPKVSLSGKEVSSGTTSPAQSITRAAVFDDSIAYLRVASLASGASGDVKAAYEKLARTNRINGIVLDLRFVSGEDYAAAVGVADLFIPRGRTLLTWGRDSFSATTKTEAITTPAVLLVNSKTAGAAEALAAVMRFANVGLIIGAPTAGQAATKSAFPLNNGQVLQVATSPVLLGDGTPLSAKGVTPDIQVQVKASEEQLYFKDPFALLPESRTNADNLTAVGTAGATNRPPRRVRYSEADLAREKREGTGSPEVPRAAEPEKPSVNDPVLARALDLLKGLAVVRGK